VTTITISLPVSLKAFIDAQLATKGFGNVSEYFRSLLREAQAKEQEARLEALVLEGLASNSIPLDANFRRGLNAKVEQILDTHRDHKRARTCWSRHRQRRTSFRRLQGMPMSTFS
jgi:antitoxin ParD1/3/4